MNRRQFRSAKSAMQQFQSDSLDRSESRCSFLYRGSRGIVESNQRVRSRDRPLLFSTTQQNPDAGTILAPSRVRNLALPKIPARKESSGEAAVTVRGTLLLKKTSSSLRPHWNVDSASHQRRRALRWFLTAIIFSLPFIDAKLHPAIAAATPAALPGTVQAEDFDDGGAGVSYRDTTPGNSGGQYRATDVDIEDDCGQWWRIRPRVGLRR